MQWDGTKNAGFTQTNVKPWLPINSKFTTVNVEVILIIYFY